MVKKFISTIMTITLLLTNVSPITAKASTEQWVDISNPALIGCRTIRGERVYYDKDNYLQNGVASNGTTIILADQGPAKFHDGSVYGKTDYPYEKTYYYLLMEAGSQSDDEIIKCGSTSYDEIAAKATQTVSYEYYKNFLADDVASVKEFDEAASQYGPTNKNNRYITTDDYLDPFVNYFAPRKTYYYSSFMCDHTNCGYTKETDPFGYHIGHTYLTYYDFMTDSYENPNGYLDAGQSWDYMSPIYEYKKCFDHELEIEPLSNYITSLFGCQQKNYIIPKRATRISDPYTGEAHYDIAQADINYRNASVNVTTNGSSTESTTGSTTSSTSTESATKSTTESTTKTNNKTNASTEKTTNFKNTGKEDSVTSDSTAVSNRYKVTSNKSVQCTEVVINKKGNVTIPDTVKVNGKLYNVTSISSDAIKSPKKIKSITLGKNIKKVNANVFNSCTNLKSVIFNASKITISNNAFSKCKKLQSLRFNNKKVKITVSKKSFSRSKVIKLKCKYKKNKAVIKKAFTKAKYKVKF